MNPPSDAAGTVVLNISMDVDLKRRINETASRQGSNVSAWIRRIAKEEIMRLDYARRDEAQGRYAEFVRQNLLAYHTQRVREEMERAARENSTAR